MSPLRFRKEIIMEEQINNIEVMASIIFVVLAIGFAVLFFLSMILKKQSDKLINNIAIIDNNFNYVINEQENITSSIKSMDRSVHGSKEQLGDMEYSIKEHRKETEKLRRKVEYVRDLITKNNKKAGKK